MAPRLALLWLAAAKVVAAMQCASMQYTDHWIVSNSDRITIQQLADVDSDGDVDVLFTSWDSSDPGCVGWYPRRRRDISVARPVRPMFAARRAAA